MTYEGTEVLNYRLTDKLGEGGFGVVYLAEHTELSRKAAVKILHPEFSRKKEVVDRFFHEANLVCTIGHDNIIDVQNFGRLETGEPFLFMEFFPGPTLAEITAERGPLPANRLADLLAPVVDALDCAHAKGVIHRDLKPENIMVMESDGRFTRVKLVDFGIAKLTDSSVVQSRSNIAMGTPQYMAPEQARDAKNVDARADVYSFGATAYCALAGRPPFLADNLADLIIEITSRDPPPLEKVARVPKSVADAIAACLAKRPEDRPPTIRAAWDRIAGALAGHDLLPAHPASRGWPIGPPPAPAPTSPDRRWIWAVALLGVAGTGAAIAAVALGSADDPGADAAAIADAGPVIDAAPPPPVIDAAPPPPVIDARPPAVDAGERRQRVDAAPRPPVDAAPPCDDSLCSLEPPPACCARRAGYSRAEIRRAMARVESFIGACFALDDSTGAVKVQVRVGRDGSIRGVDVLRSPSSTMATCVSEGIKRHGGRLGARRRPGRFRYTFRDGG